jgi:LexA-binding, inner membrane-associated putative hydrolase
MMGRTHAATGALAGLLVGRLIGLDTAPELLPFAAVVAGYALVPDLDHPQATATRILGPVTGWLSRRVRALSAWIYHRTMGPRDWPGAGTHRCATHTTVGAIVLGVLCLLATLVGGPVMVAVWLGFGLALGADRLGRVVLLAYAVGVSVWLPGVLASHAPLGAAVGTALSASAGWLGVAVALGSLIHSVGDAITRTGAPLLWPLLIRGQRWYPVRLPARLRLYTGGRVELRLIWPLVIVGCVAALPGVVPAVIHGIDQVSCQGASGVCSSSS